MPGVAGRRSVVKVAGTPTAMTAEVTTGTGNISYQITNAAKRVLDRTATITVLVGGSPVAANTYTLNRLSGTVTFGSAAPRTVTITGTYLPMVVAARTDKYSWAGSTNSVDDTDFDTAYTDNGFTRRAPTVKDIGGTIGGKIDVVATFANNFMNDDVVMIELYPDRTGPRDLACWARLQKFALNAAMESMHGQDIEFTGEADADLRVVSA